MSARRTSPLVLTVSIGSVLVGLTLLLSPQAAAAQCSGDQPSACCTCHAATHPVANQGEWHIEHVGRDCCRYCHGGNDQTLDQAQAHIGVLRQPLDDAYLSCHSCHPDDYRARAAKFAVVLNLTSGSSEPVTHPVALVTANQAPPAAPADQSSEPLGTDDYGAPLLMVALIGAGVMSVLWGWGWRTRQATL
ncbi:MAG: hypothetical protein HY870_20585 [Chloroflexi bacterium]|nr:hypothetical protein [Chloroflexota bacterium]